MSAAPAKKQTSKVDKDLSRIITPKFRVSYPHVFKPQAAKPGDDLKYSITMLFPKDKDLMGQTVDGKPRSIKEVLKNAKVATFGSKENWPEDLISPVTDGDNPKFADKEGYKGHWIIKASSNEDQKPGLVDNENIPITEVSDFYPGCYARAYIFAYTWEYMGKQGVSFILDHVQKLADGKSFGGKKPVEQVFSPISSEEDDHDTDDGDDDDMDFT